MDDFDEFSNGGLKPSIIENRDFVNFSEEEINHVTGEEEQKFRNNGQFESVQSHVEESMGPGGQWEKHWIALDASGRRAFADIYYRGDVAVAVTCDGEIIKQFHTD